MYLLRPYLSGPYCYLGYVISHPLRNHLLYVTTIGHVTMMVFERGTDVKCNMIILNVYLCKYIILQVSIYIFKKPNGIRRFEPNDLFFKHF